jgi:hypothetical protein
MILLGTPI